MKRSLVRLFCCVALLAGLIALVPEGSRGQSPQPEPVAPTEFYRFVVSYSDGGYFYTGSHQEGLAWSYFFNKTMTMNRGNFLTMGIYVPPSGWTPDPASGLVPLHRWQVVEDGWRVYYYYSTYYGNLGGNYHYHGIQGYVFPPGQSTSPVNGASLTQLSSWYSQDYGYWYGTGVPVADAGLYIEPTPNGSFVYQGITAAMPAAVTSTRFPPSPLPGSFPTIWNVWFYPPDATPTPTPTPPPPGSCNATSAMRNACAHNGGLWNDESCSCEY